MGRGKSQKTKVKEAASLSVPLLLAEKQASLEAEAKKPWGAVLKEQLQNFMSNVRVTDVIDVSAWIGIAYLIKPLLQRMASLQPMMMASKAAHSGNPLAGIEPFETADSIANYLETLLFGKPIPVSPEVAAKIIDDIKKADLEWWLLSLAVSALILKFGPAVLEAVGGLGKLAGLLLIA